MINTLLFFICLLQTSVKASISKRGAFLIESSLMIANNLIFFCIWSIFFRQFNDVGGWGIHDMAILMAIGAGSFGLMQVFFGGVRELSRMIVNGDLDSFMTKPKNLLLHIAGSKSFSKGWGHLMTAALLIIFDGTVSLYQVVLIVLSILNGCLVFTSMNLIAHSLPFWMGSMRGVSKKYCDALYLFALYPTNIYSGILQVVMFTLVPAGIISYLPIELIKQFSWEQFCLLIVSSSLFCVAAILVFHLGLRRYESGNKFGV